MLRQSQHEITIATRGRAFHDFTEEISALLHATKIQTGQVTLHLQHTSASLLIQENADPDVRRDFESFFARLVPDGDEIFIHTAEGEDGSEPYCSHHARRTGARDMAGYLPLGTPYACPSPARGCSLHRRVTKQNNLELINSGKVRFPVPEFQIQSVPPPFSLI
jgi:thiamine phosphate synthase YjbQ (UPF0047 family)